MLLYFLFAALQDKVSQSGLLPCIVVPMPVHPIADAGKGSLRMEWERD